MPQMTGSPRPGAPSMRPAAGRAQARRDRYAAGQAYERANVTADRLARRMRELPDGPTGFTSTAPNRRFGVGDGVADQPFDAEVLGGQCSGDRHLWARFGGDRGGQVAVAEGAD